MTLGNMKGFVILGICSAVLAATPAVWPQASAQAEKRVNFTSGNWNTNRAKRPPANGQPRRKINFLNIFGPSQYDRRSRRQGTLPPALFPDGFIGGPLRTAPTIAPDAPVAEYVEKPKIFVYPEQKLLALRDAGLSGETETPQAAAILQVLRDGNARVEVAPAARKAIIAFYKARKFAPLWLADADVSVRGQQVLAALARAHEHGLDDAHYRVPVVWENAADAGAIAGNALALARLDVELTAMALRFARHLSGGVVNPNAISSYHDLKPPKVAYRNALKKLAQEADAASWLQSLAPRHFAYGLMKLELARLNGTQEEKLLPPVPVGRLIRPGMRDERLVLIRQHLRKLGVLKDAPSDAGEAGNTDDAITAEPTAGAGNEALMQPTSLDGGTGSAAPDPRLYDKTVERAVRAFQRMAGLKPDGIIGKGTIRALNRRNSISTRKDRIARLKLNMERLRWMPRDFGNPHFLVNVPAFEVYLYQDGKVRWKSRVITGKPQNQTYFFSDEIEYVEFNPYWGVPQSIIRKEFIPKLMKNPYWLDQEGYEVRDRKGRLISSASVDWASWRNAKVIPFNIRQLPGDNNALGRLKVMFPNKHAIYMHDTPFKNLFNRSRRAFSHGCVRVQKPRELAELVSGLDPYEIESYLKAGENKQVRIRKKIPVHIAYFTAWPDDNGRMRYYEDVYSRDSLLKTALAKHDAAYRRGMEMADLR